MIDLGEVARVKKMKKLHKELNEALLTITNQNKIIAELEGQIQTLTAPKEGKKK